jgi:hypothetical protein
MECISIFDMLKIGVGPSSSHTLGPWRAAERWIKELKDKNRFDKVEKITVDLYGSLSLTGADISIKNTNNTGKLTIGTTGITYVNNQYYQPIS